MQQVVHHKKVWLQVNIEDVATETLDGVVECCRTVGCNALATLDVGEYRDVAKVCELHAEVVNMRDLVHRDLALFNVVVLARKVD